MHERRCIRLLVALLLPWTALCAGGCATQATVSLPVASGPLVSVETRGGLCVDGPCGATIVIERDGRVHQAAKPPNHLGTVTPDALATLGAALRATDFAALRRHPFVGQCPAAYDGQETVFEFGTPGGVERIASCEVDVDPGAPLFMAVATALAPFVQLPTP